MSRFLDGIGVPVEWTVDIVIPIFNWTGDIRNCSCYIPLKLLEHREGGGMG